MYDIHCHILPAIDDGASDMAMALNMARIAVEDGITHLAATPHIYPGLFDNSTQTIEQAADSFRKELQRENIPLELSTGADIQMVDEMARRLKQGSMPTINHSRYCLFEPPHHIAPPRFLEAIHNVTTSGFTPLITHPERLSWIEEHYAEFLSAVKSGAWMQITAGSLTGQFGARPRHWAEKMIKDGIVHVIASDGHNLTTRAPQLKAGRHAALQFVDNEEADALVLGRPKAVWNDIPPDQVSTPPGLDNLDELISRYNPEQKKKGFLKRLFSR